MIELIFATNNLHKVREIQLAITDEIRVVSLKEAGIDIDIPEPFATLRENASVKSKTIHQLTGRNCFSEDTGLEVDSLSGEPGVKSARYAGENRSFEKNIEKLLLKLKNTKDREARFRTVISLIFDNKEHFFEGVCEGSIASHLRGGNGFGYDAVFLPRGSETTFAEMTAEEKNHYSHRRKALDKLIIFLQHYHGKN
jgi:XTP/dITP diphosphohydrolase